MRVRLADVGDPLSTFARSRDPRSRSLRFPEGGEGGGGTGSKDSKEENDDAEDEDDEDEGEAGDEEEEKEGDGKGKPDELKKAIARRDRALREKRKLQDELAAERAKNEKAEKNEPDPVEKANTRLVRQATRTALAAAGVTDREDQKLVIDALNLSGISVDDDGVDEDDIEDRISELRRIFGGTGKASTKRTPRVDTRDKGGSNGNTTDPDAARYKRILGRAK